MFTKTICFVRDPYHEIRLILSDARFSGFLKRLENLDSVLRVVRHARMHAIMTKTRSFLDNFKTAIALEVLRGDKRVISKSGV